MTKYYQNITTEVPRYIFSTSMSDLSLMVSYLLNNVDPFAKSCIWSIDESFDLFFPRGYKLDDLWRVLFNFGYRFGNMYDLVNEFVDIFLFNLGQTYFTKTEWNYIGSIPGRILSEVLYPEKYGDVVIVYPDDN